MTERSLEAENLGLGLVTSAEEKGNVSHLLVCSSVCVFSCEQGNSKSCGPIFMKLDGLMGMGTNRLYFGTDPNTDHGS